MNIYILTEVDLNNYGFNPKEVFVFKSLKEAKDKMTELYLNIFEKIYGKDENPYEEKNYDYQITDDFAYISGEYYLDIFVKEIS